MSLKRSLCSLLFVSQLFAGGCTTAEMGGDGDGGDGGAGGAGGTAADASPDYPESQVASELTLTTTGVDLWRTSSQADDRVQFVGEDKEGVELLRGTATADLSGETLRWVIDLELPYAAQAQYFEDALQPQPSGDAGADVLFEAVTRDIFLGETRITPVAQSSSANEPDLKIVPRIPTNDVLDSNTLYKARDGLHCLRRFMLASYMQNPPQSICHLDLETAYSNVHVKLYSGVDADGKTRRVVIAFRGTVTTFYNPLTYGDALVDLQSAVNKQHKNPLMSDSQALGGGRAGAGWVNRWVNQAKLKHANGKSLVGRLKEHADLAKGQGQKLVTYVTGHSLGAATADVASHDIAAWQKTQSQLAQEVVAASFNPPRFGRVGAREAYQDALKSTCGGPTKGKLCLTRWALTRALDGVQSLPPSSFLNPVDQIVWQTGTSEPGRRKIGRDKNAGTVLPYCPQFNAPPVTKNPIKVTQFENHYQQYWDDDIEVNLTKEHLACMFRRLDPVETNGSCNGCPGGGSPGNDAP